MKKILIVCPSSRDTREINRSGLNETFQVEYHRFDDAFFEARFYHEKPGEPPFDFAGHIQTSLEELAQKGYDGIISVQDHPGSALAAIYARALGLPGPDPQVVIRCQHKFEAREQQRRFVPEATPHFALVHSNQAGKGEPPLPFPFFIKPVKGRFSAFARAVHDQAEWRALAHEPLLPPRPFCRGFNTLLQYLDDYQGDGDCLIAESLLQGTQVTLDGMVTGGKVSVLGIVDSFMYPNTISFSRFQHPSALPTHVQERMALCAIRYIEGIGLDQTMFNIEFFYDSQQDSIHIIEMNPRAASGFADLYEKVHGLNLLEPAMRLACGETPSFQKGAGGFTHAAAFIERIFQDRFVRAIPAQEQVAAVYRRFPEARVELCAKPGEWLSQKMQDLASFRYALIHLGGDSVSQLEEKHRICQEMLPFDFSDEAHAAAPVGEPS